MASKESELNSYKNSDKSRLFKGMLMVLILGIGIAAPLFFIPRLSPWIYSLKIRSIDPIDGVNAEEWPVSKSVLLDARLYLPDGLDIEENSVIEAQYAFNNRSDNNPGLLLDIDGSNAGVLMFHGYTRDLNDNNYLAALLARRGIVVLSISSRGHGLSSGEIVNSLNETFGDALAAYLFLSTFSFVDKSKILAHGTSMGGAQSLFLSLINLTGYFVVWFPAIGLYYNSQPLYNYSNPSLRGLICAGTSDNCSACKPFMNDYFLENNPNIDIIWREGAVHTDPRFYSDNVRDSLDWMEKKWYLREDSVIEDWYYMGYLAAVPLALSLLIDLFLSVKYLRLKRSRR